MRGNLRLLGVVDCLALGIVAGFMTVVMLTVGTAPIIAWRRRRQEIRMLRSMLPTLLIYIYIPFIY